MTIRSQLYWIFKSCFTTPSLCSQRWLEDFSVVVLQNSTNFITIYCIDLHFLADKKDWSLSTLGNFHS